MTDVRVYNNLSKVLPIKAVTTDYGVKVTLPEALYIDHFPTTDFYTFEFRVAASQWSDAGKFPCKVSQFEPTSQACDYYLHGWQTKLYNQRVQLTDIKGEAAMGKQQEWED